uniref:RING-type E3 ubiquitin transferase n=1 Tax=Timema poppense TaxID=170557 RepID=A0A7R9CL42_TIMPO|nr:unnamed protein product [Timema poppensis]
MSLVLVRSMTQYLESRQSLVPGWLRLYSACTRRIFLQHGAARIDDRDTCFHDRPHALLVLSLYSGRAQHHLYYGGEALTVEQPQAFTCPYCGKMGFTETTLQEHVTSEHSETSFEVVCPVCASLPGGDPNLVTDDFAGHLTLEHRSGPRDLISFLISF